MNRLHIVGRKNHGKTTLIVELLHELTHRGLAVGTIKHSSHVHELDTPGKDSYRHRLAGAAVVGVLSDSVSAVYWCPDSRQADEYERLAPMFAGCDLVLVEGDLQTAALKLEVWRSGLGSPPLAVADQRISGIITDDAVDGPSLRLSRRNIARLADWVCESVLGVELAKPNPS